MRAAAQMPAHDVALPHDPLGPLAVDPHTLVVQPDGHPRGSVSAAGFGVNPGDLLGEGVLVGGVSLSGGLAGCPAVEAGAGHRRDRKRLVTDPSPSRNRRLPYAGSPSPAATARPHAEAGRSRRPCPPPTTRPARGGHSGPGPAFGGAHPVPQDLVTHPQLTGYLVDRPLRRADQVDRVTPEFFRVLRWTPPRGHPSSGPTSSFRVSTSQGEAHPAGSPTPRGAPRRPTAHSRSRRCRGKPRRSCAESGPPLVLSPIGLPGVDRAVEVAVQDQARRPVAPEV
ncbi:hypothetical protein GA0070558_13264 [Micromonospora haikouensis]|uniref:Uncharacterized protein n=1 Tax=Micromonospora haikouensis TaxID=686309 RepID=A0A1C4Y070_9ACTN|nr:hypothetical protein GA0070558_13264 [Micromonospora haikouensis]